MPFDKPRLFSPGAPASGDLAPRDAALGEAAPGNAAVDEELGLSAELQVLAAHLRGEADALADRYAPPAGAPSPGALKGDASNRPARDRGAMRRWMWQSMAVGLAGLALLVWQVERRHESPQPAAERLAKAIPSDTAHFEKKPSNATLSETAQSTTVPPAVAATAVVGTNRTASRSENAPAPDPAAIRHSQGIAEVGIEPPAVERHPPADQVEMLRIQVSGFEKVIQKLQVELMAREAAQIESQRQIESLQEEVASLRKQLAEKH